MRFDSAEFLLFFAACWAAHRALPWRRTVLLVASLGFYASWNPPFLLLLLLSAAVDWRAGLSIVGARTAAARRAWVAVSLTINLGMLGAFKYWNFLLDTVSGLGLPAAALAPWRLDVVLPLGISFYTFQTLGYTLDVARGRAAACRSLPDFLLFVSFFPQLIAGPVVRAGQLVPQLSDTRRADAEDLWTGLELLLIGWFSKVVVADAAATLVDRVYGDPGRFAGFWLLVAAIAFTVQVYSDFSGYSNMARGMARMLGYHLPRNFAFALTAPNPLEFRRRWHMTMGEWFRDHVYRPLGGDRGGFWRTQRNTLITWALFGLWHGAAWTFVCWGLYNGLLVAGYRAWRRLRPDATPTRASRLLGRVSVPLFIGGAAVFFRAPDMDAAWRMAARILRGAPGEAPLHVAWLGVFAAFYIGLHLAERYWREGALWRAPAALRPLVVAVALLLLMLLAGNGKPFVYFQF